MVPPPTSLHPTRVRVLVAQTMWLVLLGKGGERTVDANNEMCVTCLPEASSRRKQWPPSPHPQGACALAAQPTCQFLKVNKSLNISCHFSSVTFGFALWNVWSCHLAGRRQVLGKSLAFPVDLSQGLGAYRPGSWQRPSTGFPFIPPHPNIPPPLGPLIHVCKRRNRNLTKRLFLWGSLMAE